MDLDYFDPIIENQIAKLQAELYLLRKEIKPKLYKIILLKERVVHFKGILDRKIEQLAVEVLKVGPLHYTEIMRQIETQYKVTIPGKNPKRNFVAHLCGSDNIVRISRGGYGLAKRKIGGER